MKYVICFLFIIQLVAIPVAFAQDDEESSLEVYTVKQQTEAGFVFSMAETGSGVGFFLALPFGSRFHVGATIDAFFIRDSKQFDYIDYYGRPNSVNNVNDVYIFDAMITIKRRFFAEEMHDSFRPFLAGGFGPVYGMNFPNLDGLKDQYELTFGGFVGGGVDITVDKKYFVSARAQYRILPFSNYLGETPNHSMFELRFEVGRRF
jgi:hypothetical protein